MESCDQYEEEDWWKDSHGTNNSEIRKLGVVIKATCDKACAVIFVDYIAIFSTNIVNLSTNSVKISQDNLQISSPQT